LKTTKKSTKKTVATKKSTQRQKSGSQDFNFQGLQGLRFMASQVWKESLHQESKKTKSKISEQKKGFLYVVHLQDQPQRVQELIRTYAMPWQMDQLLEHPKEVYHFSSSHGPVWILVQKTNSPHSLQHFGLLEESEYTWAREQAGSLLQFIKPYQLDTLEIHFETTHADVELGFYVGWGISQFQFKTEFLQKKSASTPSLFVMTEDPDRSHLLKSEAQRIIQATNLSRHWVSLPPNVLTPQKFVEQAKILFSSKSSNRSSTMDLEVWDSSRLKKEQMNLHLAVGAGSENPPCLLILRYRPIKKSRRRPVALVGKGLTFDTGGLDIKPSSGMRLMKKDMGGAASVLAVATWVQDSKYPHPVDFYLGLAENSVDGKSYRPSDVIRSRQGSFVEIHNTDAEGRLVLADVLDVAIQGTKGELPDCVIDVATLTGAIKVALGADVAGLFSNHDELAQDLQLAGAQAGDYCWRMPLVQKYAGSLNSHFADFANCSDGFGGAIIAALFLEKFVGQKVPWAHLDIYSWNDRPSGSLSSVGGSGQGVQILIEFLKGRLADNR
jgi:leucyl aminopeptidase